MNARQIEAFRLVMSCGGVSAAARRMNVSQPSVSRLITELERASGLTLFDRHRGKTTPREEAVSFYEEVEKLFFGLTHLRRAAEDIRNMGQRALRVTCFPAAGNTLLPDIVAQFRHAQPATGIALDIRTSDGVLDLMALGTADVGITASAREHASIETVATFTALCMCVMRASDPLAAMPVVELAKLKCSSVVWVEPDSQITAAVWPRISEADVLRQRTIETNLALPACRLVQNGLGVAIVDPMTARMPLCDGLVLRLTNPEIAYRIRVVTSRVGRRSKPAQRFIDLLVSECGRAFGHSGSE
jgi:DNA-binding transcriptional LysR family regulator